MKWQMAYNLCNRQQTKTQPNATFSSSLTSTTCEMSCTGIRSVDTSSRELWLACRDSAEGDFLTSGSLLRLKATSLVAPNPITATLTSRGWISSAVFKSVSQNGIEKEFIMEILSFRGRSKASTGFTGQASRNPSCGNRYLLHDSKLDWEERDRPLMSDSTWAALWESVCTSSYIA